VLLRNHANDFHDGRSQVLYAPNRRNVTYYYTGTALILELIVMTLTE